MWDKTRDGNRRLKFDAVPTIFGEFSERIIPVQTIPQAVYDPAQIKLETGKNEYFFAEIVIRLIVSHF